jgi:uncharacterized protein involved in response to NO
MANLVQIETARLRPTGALLRQGFRPFFLLAAAWAATSILWWALVLAGVLPARSPQWHGHEMLSGFTLAVVAGFLLTAVLNWTGRVTARGPTLAVLAGLWIAARIAALVAPTVEGPLDVLFLAGLLIAIGGPIFGARNLRNAPFLVVLAAWAALDLVFHVDASLASWALARQLDLVAFLMVVITGRVVPGFTANALPRADVVRSPRVDVAAVLATAFSVVWPPLACLAGTLVLVRARGWRSIATRSAPILWVLHLGNIWLAVGLFLRGLGALAVVPPTLGTHALTAGAIGTLTLGMMTRVSLGHTGRPLLTPRASVVGYGFVTLAAILRAAAALVPSVMLWVAAAIAFAAAYVAFLIDYAPILVRPRADGAAE